MKKLSLIISLLIALAFLSSCTTVTTVTPTALAEITSTSTPTSIPLTATIEPSPTVDPNMPEGATGKDAQGNWIKPLLDASGKPVMDEKGNPVNETWETYSSGPNGETMTGLFVNHIKQGTLDGGIPTVDKTAQTSASLPIYFMGKDGIQAKFLQHIPGTGLNPGVNYVDNTLYVLT